MKFLSICRRFHGLNSLTLSFQACVVHPLSNCAISFAVHPPSHEQQLCEAYRETLSTNHTDVAKLICHDKLKSVFIVCPINTASAVRMKCVNNTFFSQRLQKCVPDEEDSECPIEWKEIARESTPKGICEFCVRLRAFFGFLLNYPFHVFSILIFNHLYSSLQLQPRR